MTKPYSLHTGLLCARAFCSMLLAAVLLSTATVASAAADTYPSKAIKLLVPFSAGGPSDTMARRIAEAMQPFLGQTIYIDNKPGAAGIVGTKIGADAAPDGYTIILGGTGTHNTNEFLYDTLPYDPQKDFIPVGLLYKANNVFVVSADSEIRTLDGLVQIAKKKPGELNYAIGAIGSSSHLAFEAFKSEAGLDIVGIPYNGMLAAYTDLIGGRIQVLPNDILNVYQQIKAGKVRALAITSKDRFPFMPDVPTVAESGFPGFEGVGWAGLFVPAGTPQAVVEKIADSLRQAFQTPELRKDMEAKRVQLFLTTPKEFADFVDKERIKWAKVIKEADIKLK